MYVRLGVSQKRVIIGKFPQEIFIFLTRGVPLSKRSRMAGVFRPGGLLYLSCAIRG